MFRAKVESEKSPITIQRLTDGHRFSPCFMASNGASNWAPSEGDQVIADEVDGFVFVLYRIDSQDGNASQGVQIGDASKGNGIEVSDDGLFTSIRSDTNTLIVDEQGVHLNVTEDYDIQGSGYTFKVNKADKSATLETKVEEDLKCPLPSGGGTYHKDVKGTMAGAITVTTTITTPSGVATAFEHVVYNDGRVELTVSNATGVPIHQDTIDATGNRVIYGNTGTVTLGAPAGAPIVMGAQMTAIMTAILTALTAHASSVPVHGVADTALSGECGTVAGMLSTMNSTKVFAV